MPFIFNLFVGVIAGIGSRYVEKPLGAMISDKIELPEADLRVLAFAACLVAASFVMLLAGVNGMPLVVVLGGALGIFGSHVLTFSRKQKAFLEKKLEERRANAGGSQEVEPRVSPKKSKKTSDDDDTDA